MSIEIAKEHVISTTDARRNLSKYLEEAKRHSWFIFKNATPRAVILDIDDYEVLKRRIDELEELLDHAILAKELEVRRTAPGKEEEIDLAAL